MAIVSEGSTTQKLVLYMVLIFKHGVFVLGILAMMMIDLVLGASFYGDTVVNKNGFTVFGYGISGVQFGWGIASAPLRCRSSSGTSLERVRSFKEIFLWEHQRKRSRICVVIGLTVSGHPGRPWGFDTVVLPQNPTVPDPAGEPERGLRCGRCCHHDAGSLQRAHHQHGARQGRD